MLHSSIQPNQLFTLMSLNVPTVQGRLRGSCGTLGRALGWIHSSHLYYSALQTLAPHLTALRRALGAVSSEGQEARDTQARIPPHGSPTAIDKEPACAAWALWCSPSCTGTSEIHLQPPEPSWGDLQGSGAQAAGVMVRKGSTEVS